MLYTGNKDLAKDMSENLEELLDIADEENEGEYDLADDEEDALLDENYDLANKTQSIANCIQGNTEPEQDVLDLDDETELNDEDSENLNSTVEEEERCRKDKFLNERIVPQKEQQLFMRRKFKQSFRGSFNRGRRFINRGNFHNNVNRASQFQQNKVLINPHFKGNVQIKHNAWDKSHSNNNGRNRKPVIHIQPWAQQQNPEVVQYQQNPIRQDVYVNQQCQSPLQNSRLPVHQRLGTSNMYNQSLPDNQSQFIQNFQQPAYQQVIPQNQFPQNPIYTQAQFVNGYSNQFIPPMYCHNTSNNNNNIKTMNSQLQSHCIYPIGHSQQMPSVNFNSNQNYSDYLLQNPQTHFVQTFNNPPQNIVNYPSNVPVVNNETMNVEVPYFEEQEILYPPIRKYNGASPGKRKFDFKIDLKKKKRTALSSNLHEVKTVDVKVFEEKPQISEEEDEEMKAYRKKIEHQKLVREKLLRQKEERRKQAARKLQAEEQYKSLLSPTDILKEEIPVIMNSTIPTESQSSQITKPTKKSQIVRVNKTIIPIKTIDNPLNIKRVVSAKPMSCDNVSADSSESGTLNKDQLSCFLSNRKIFAKDKSLVDTSLVVINNLATGTSEVKLRKLCQGVGDIQNLQMSTQERQATIQFKSVASAHAFYKKYQRFMLDLSMIQVTLKPLS